MCHIVFVTTLCYIQDEEHVDSTAKKAKRKKSYDPDGTL